MLLVGTAETLYGHGQIVANLSATDFVSLSTETNFEILSHLTVREFLTGKHSIEEADDEVSDYTSPAVCITSKGSILTAAFFMIEHHMHRVWVVAPSDYSGMEGYGVGCISLTDVLTTIALFSSPKTTPR